MPRRNDIQKILVIIAVASCSAFALLQAQTVDCVYPSRIFVCRVQGHVFDPFGTAVPGVVLSLVNGSAATLQTTSDNQGGFRLAAPPGKYSLKAVFPMFQTSQAELNVSEDSAGLVRPGNLYVILGMTGSFCAWVTTSKKDFDKIIRANKKRLKEAAENNATQK